MRRAQGSFRVALAATLVVLAPWAAGGRAVAAEADLLGELDRQQLEEAHPEWVATQVESSPDAAAVAALAALEPGAVVTVYLGTWCSDSRREVARLWATLDAAVGWLPFEIRYVGIDEAKREPAAAVAAGRVTHVPTFVVERDGRELGRVVEESVAGIEGDLLALLTGEASGLLTASDEIRRALADP